VLALLVLVATSCGGATDVSDDPWAQNWILDAVQTSDGSIDDVGTPLGVSIQFLPTLQGSDGCSLFEGSYDYANSHLRFLEIERMPEPEGCPEEYLPIVSAMRLALAGGVEVTELSSDTMVWQSNGVVFEFVPGREG